MSNRSIQANADHVFIKRYPMEKTFLGLDISEKALTKNYIGRIEAINDSYKNVGLGVGDDIHVPHYMVNDVEIDGTEYAITKVGDLFAKKEGDTYLPVNGYVLVRKCENDHIRDESGEIALYMTENHIEHTHWVEVIAVADDCKMMDKKYIGYFCVAPESDDKLQRILYSKDYCLHESLIKFVTPGD